MNVKIGNSVAKMMIHEFLFYMCVCMHACIPSMCVQWKACRGEERASDPIELEIKMTVSHHVSAKNRTAVLCKENNLNLIP